MNLLKSNSILPFKERVSNKKSQRSNFEGKSGFLVAGSCEATSEDEI
jgi:hypothetical protein